MGMLYFLKLLFVLLPIISSPVDAQEGSTCELPNNKGQSKCIRLHNCNSFWTVVRESGGKPPQAAKDIIIKHSCGRNQLVCCPDNAMTSKPPPVEISPSTNTRQPVTSTLPSLSDLNAVTNHVNFKLINDRKCGASTRERIIGGKAANPGDFPWMALLQFRGRLQGSLTFNCGGALISPFYVLTAAHCVNRDLLAVRLGEHVISTEQDCDADNFCQDPVQDIQIEKAIRHKQYDGRKKINDIALLRLKTAADITKKNVKTICLPTTVESQIDNIDKPARDKMLISGWGLVESGKPSDILLQAHLPYVTNSDCVQRFAPAKLQIYETYLCAGGEMKINKTDTCNGDSGGPIQTYGFINNKNRIILYGVVSVGVKCLDAGVTYPGIYTNVAYYLSWIMDNMTT